MSKKQQILRAAGLIKEADDILEGICPSCHTPINMKDFQDALSKKEFIISGLCQKCQDRFFK